MKKYAVALLLMTSVPLVAQTNFQLHYDLGKGRHYFTSTLEMFKPDTWGNTFFFVDVDYDLGKDHNPSLAYMELARCFHFLPGPFSLQIEYDGGLGLYQGASGTEGYPINNAYLAGVDYEWHNTDYTHTFNLKALYKYLAGLQHSAQLTAVWNVISKKTAFSGFADLWLEDDKLIHTSFIFLSEPQFWYLLNDHLAIGSELELALHAAHHKEWTICPTVGMKWQF
jgi:hypothetical protein